MSRYDYGKCPLMFWRSCLYGAIFSTVLKRKWCKSSRFYYCRTFHKMSILHNADPFWDWSVFYKTHLNKGYCPFISTFSKWSLPYRYSDQNLSVFHFLRNLQVLKARAFGVMHFRILKNSNIVRCVRNPL